MRRIVLMLLAAILFTACTKEDRSSNLEGSYTGTFTRTDPTGGNTPTANVTIEFTEDHFKGHSDITNYPAVCSGSYILEGNQIKALNKCFFTANFDWTFIFTNDYNYEFNGTNLKIWREYSGGAKDIYLLRKD